MNKILQYFKNRLTVFIFLIIFIWIVCFIRNAHALSADEAIVNNTFNIISHNTEEGYSAKQYKDGEGIAIGYGTNNISRFTKKTQITKREAESFAKKDILHNLKLLSNIKITITDNLRLCTILYDRNNPRIITGLECSDIREVNFVDYAEEHEIENILAFIYNLGYTKFNNSKLKTIWIAYIMKKNKINIIKINNKSISNYIKNSSLENLKIELSTNLLEFTKRNGEFLYPLFIRRMANFARTM
jgi:GH24 family phage-related lysozyme (muramidase)